MAVFNPFNSENSTVVEEDKPEERTEIPENLLFSFTPAKFDMFVKVLSLFDKSSDSIKITQSQVVQKYSAAVINADMSTLFDDQEVDLEIIQPKKYTKLFKQFRNASNIDIIQDDDNNRYIITNGEIKVFLPKQVTTDSDDTMMPDFDGCVGLWDIKIDKETSRLLNGLSSDVNFIEYLIQDNKLKGLHVPDTAIFLFGDYLKDPKAKTLDETNSEVTLRTGVFLPIVADDYNISIGKLKNEEYFSITECNTGLIKINVIEKLEVTTGGNLLI